MMDSISGATPLNVLELSNVSSVDSVPPTGKPIALSDIKPDVSVAISEMAQARMESMAAPSEALDRSTVAMDSRHGGVDKGGFDWPLNSRNDTTAQVAKFDGESTWEAQGEVVNGVLQSESNESAYIALGKSTVSASN
jgi:hypothetical protein